MKLLALLVAVFSIVSGITGVEEGEPLVELLGGTGLICAFTTYQSHKISSFLKIFAAIFATQTIVFGILYLLTKVGAWPESLEDYVLPGSLPLTVALFAILVYAVSFIPVVRSMTRIADRYFNTTDLTRARIWPFPSFGASERHLATTMIVFLVLINQAQVALTVRLTFFRRDWYNALQAKDAATFWYQIFAVFAPVAFVLIGSRVIEFLIQSTLIIRWRRWLTGYFQNRWLNGSTHYRMSLVSTQTDNPDQRISEDINRFIDGGQIGYGIYSFSILLISTLSSLVSYAIILWTISENFTIPLTDITVPGLMFWIALIYAAFGTLFTHLIGRPLVNLYFRRQKYEADFRFQLARLREYGEQVALLHGEPAERISLSKTFGSIIGNYFQIVNCRKKLIAFTGIYGQVGPFIPYFVAAPFYFSNKITLGIIIQAAEGFEYVNSALTFFIEYYSSLADFRSVLNRLTSFEAAIEKAEALAVPTPQEVQDQQERAATIKHDLDIVGLTLHLPNQQPLMENLDLNLKHQEPVLFSGPSGSGKSTLFRAVAGIWPYRVGGIALPDDAKVMLLPQRPYLPIGTLRAAIAYPAEPDHYSDADIKSALTNAKLEDLIDLLDVEDFWSQRLSGGEQQRLAIARALLAAPDWLFLDEATASVDEDMEAEIYSVLEQKLPKTTLISIGHRTSLIQFHKRQLHMNPTSKSTFLPGEVKSTAAQ